MDVRQAYSDWAAQYDTNLNKTRDLEAQALRTALDVIPFGTCLEIGCGTGKNTQWLIEKATQVTAVDLSEEMLAKAREKVTSPNVDFQQADITTAWTFRKRTYDLITFSLVLEHIGNLEYVFSEAAASLKTGGYMYIGELHPFKQYTGSKARFDTETGTRIVPCFNHHVSDFTQLPKKVGFHPVDVNEYFDDNDRTAIPRILTLLLKKG